MPSSVLTPISSGNTALVSKVFVFCVSPAAAYTALHSLALAPICCGVAYDLDSLPDDTEVTIPVVVPPPGKVVAVPDAAAAAFCSAISI